MAFSTGALTEAVTERTWEPRELGRQTAARARRLRACGIGPGLRVLLLADNTLEFFAELLAAWLVGATAVPVDGTLSAFELENLAAAVEPRLAVRTSPRPSAWPLKLPLLDSTTCG
jgi:acyl-CoA synthetase (AMP-forming)/AMP-acid ligase II